MMFCSNCGKAIPDNSRFCAECGTPVYGTSAAGGSNAANTKASGSVGEETVNKITSKINSLVGGEGAVKLRVSDLFCNVFQKHTKEERDRILIYGTSETTPDISNLIADWPKPWLYSRVFLVFLISFAALYLCCICFNNMNAIPGVIFLGSFMVPVSLLFMFYEMNVPRNISFFNVLKTFLIGGCASIFVTLILDTLFSLEGSSEMEAIVTGIVEELAKLLIVMFFIRNDSNANYLFSGLLIGAAVGAGFAAFESSGYAMRFFINGGFDTMTTVIFNRAVLAPGGHISWAAISGFAIMYAKKNEKLQFSHVIAPEFLKLFWIPVVLHALWDMPFLQSAGMLGLIVLTVISWVVLLVLIAAAFKQINEKNFISTPG